MQIVYSVWIFSHSFRKDMKKQKLNGKAPKTKRLNISTFICFNAKQHTVQFLIKIVKYGSMAQFKKLSNNIYKIIQTYIVHLIIWNTSVPFTSNICNPDVILTASWNL